MSALLGSAIIKIASFYFMLGIKSKNDVIAIMKGDNYVYNEGNNDEYVIYWSINLVWW